MKVMRTVKKKKPQTALIHSDLVTAPNCTCPLCKHVGRSVAAMNYSETQRWEKSGRFSASGIGVSTGGLGIGVAGGDYSESGEQQSKRAGVFNEPTRYALPVVSVVLVGVAAAAVFSNMPGMLSVVREVAPPSESISVAGNMRDVFEGPVMSLLTAVAPIIGVAILGVSGYRAMRNVTENDRLNAEVLPRELARYNELKYCESCHTLFDPQGRHADGNSLGFRQLMSHRAPD